MLDTLLDVWRTVLKLQIGLVYFSGSYSKICQEQPGCIRGKPLRTAQIEFFTRQSTEAGIGESWSWTNIQANIQGRIKASAGPGAVPNAGPLQTYNST